MTSHRDPPPASAPTPAPETRISTVIGDRLCIKCHFNLSGQPVVRESVYGMAIVRCPECSTVASLQEYPLLGRWAGRFAAMLAAIWLLVLIGGIFATAGLMFGMTEGCLETGCERLATNIADEHKKWYDNASETERGALSRTYGGNYYPSGPYSWMDAAWWSKQDPQSFISRAGGPVAAIDAHMFTPLAWGCFITAIFGAAWSVFLLHLRRWRIFFLAIIPAVLALLFCYMSVSTSSARWGWGGGTAVYAWHEAQRLLWPWIVTIALVSMFAFLCLGAWFGRSIIRTLVRLFLPPRMRGSLSFLWLVEGKRPPRTSP